MKSPCAKRGISSLPPSVFLILLLILICGTAFWTTPAHAAEDLLQRVPHTALGVVVANQLETAEPKVRQLLQTFHVPMSDCPVLGEIRKTAGAWFNEKGAAAVVVMPADSGSNTPQMLFFLPVKDYKRFVEALHPKDAKAAVVEVTLAGGNYVVRSWDEYAIWADSRYRQTVETLNAGTLTLADQFKAWHSWIAENDAALLLTPAGVKTAWSLGSPIIEQTVGEKLTGAGIPQTPALLIDVLRRLQPETTGLGIAVRVDAQGLLRVSCRVLVKSDGRGAKLLAGLHPAKENLLTQLPPGPFCTASVNSTPGGSFDAPDAASTESLRNALSQIQGVADVLFVSRPGDVNRQINSIQIMHVGDAETYLNQYEKVAVESFATPKGAPKATVRREKFDGLPTLVIAVNLSPLSKKSEKSPEQVATDMLGIGAEPSIWSVAVDQHTVATGYFRKDLLRACIKTIQASGVAHPDADNSLAIDARITKLASHLPKDVFWIEYCCPANVLANARQMLVNTKSAADRLPVFSSDGLIGAAFVSSQGEFQATIVVPGEVVKAAGDAIGRMNPSRDQTSGRATNAVPQDQAGKKSNPRQRAIAGALSWLVLHQAAAGNWSLHDYSRYCKDSSCTMPSKIQSDKIATSLALLTLMASGQVENPKGIYRKNITRGLGWILQNDQLEDKPATSSASDLTANSLVALILSQSCGFGNKSMSKRAQEAVEIVEETPIPTLADSRPDAEQDQILTSLAWRILALRSAQQVGLKVDLRKMETAAKQLAALSVKDTVADSRTLFQASVGICAGQILRVGVNPSRSAPSTVVLSRHLPDEHHRNAEYLFFATHAMHEARAPEWKAWNTALAKYLVNSQCRKECAAGSWTPEQISPDVPAEWGGRLAVTCLSTLALECYYEFLPLWKPRTAKPAVNQSSHDGAPR